MQYIDTRQSFNSIIMMFHKQETSDDPILISHRHLWSE